MREKMGKNWNPETDACDDCQECDYFLHEYWNCQGELEPCFEFLPKKSSKYKKVEVEIVNDELSKLRRSN